MRAAEQRLTAAPPRIHTETAIPQNKGLIALCKSELPALFASVPAQQAELDAAARAAAAALEDFQAFLEKDLLPRSDGDFRLGRARFEKKLRFTLDDAAVHIDGVVAERARAARGDPRRDARDREGALARADRRSSPSRGSRRRTRGWPLVRKVLDALAADHPTNATIVKASEELLAEATDFVRDARPGARARRSPAG